MSDQPNTAIVGADGINQAATAFPVLTETTLAEPLALTYTTPPLQRGPALGRAGRARPQAVEQRLPRPRSGPSSPTSGPTGRSHPVATGRLLSAYPNVIAAQSLQDSAGDIVEPYGDYSAKSDAAPGTERTLPDRVLADRQPLQARPPHPPGHPRRLGGLHAEPAGPQHDPPRRPARRHGCCCRCSRPRRPRRKTRRTAGIGARTPAGTGTGTAPGRGSPGS